jgi:hypothetical protein
MVSKQACCERSLQVSICSSVHVCSFKSGERIVNAFSEKALYVAGRAAPGRVDMHVQGFMPINVHHEGFCFKSGCCCSSATGSIVCCCLLLAESLTDTVYPKCRLQVLQMLAACGRPPKQGMFGSHSPTTELQAFNGIRASRLEQTEPAAVQDY